MVDNARERRSERHRNEHGHTFDADIIRHGLFLQRTGSTISAIEYFKSKGVGSAVIGRVLSGSGCRREDALALADLEPR
jgi:hypothetical protein